jgi:V-type H+-transporting ATPase subunit E
VVLTGLKGKIVVDNTLEARLEIVKEDVSFATLDREGRL